MKRYLVPALIMVLSLLLLAGVGCGKKEVPGPGSLSPQERARLEEARRLREARLAEQQARGSEARQREVFVNQDVHFEYDRYDLTAEARQVLNEKARYMQSHPDLKIIIEGHCDERGSSAYNLALGEKRAKACAAYLQAMGIAANRMETVSYGEERPLVQGLTEEAYAANRRGHFVIK